MAEGVGFEPTEACASTVFKTAAFGHSATPPGMERIVLKASAVTMLSDCRKSSGTQRCHPPLHAAEDLSLRALGIR